jgi:phosphopentomutase
MSNQLCFGAAAVLLMASFGIPAEPEVNRFIKVNESDTGGHFFSQVIYAPTAETLPSSCKHLKRLTAFR